MKAASQLFAEKGYESTRTLDIAKEANANEALILRYFGGKEGLLMAIFKDETFLQVMMQSKMNLCRDERMGKIFKKKNEKTTHIEMFKDFFSTSSDQMDLREPFMRIASSRALIDKEMANVIQTKMIQTQTLLLKDRLKEYFDEQKVKVKPEEMEALAILLSSVDYSMNFMMDRVYKLDRKKIDAVLDLLCKSLGEHFK